MIGEHITIAIIVDDEIPERKAIPDKGAVVGKTSIPEALETKHDTLRTDGLAADTDSILVESGHCGVKFIALEKLERADADTIDDKATPIVDASPGVEGCIGEAASIDGIHIVVTITR